MTVMAVSKTKLMLKAWVIGILLTILLFVVGQVGFSPTLSQTFLWPGLLFAGLLGFGAHDLALYIGIILFDSLLYGAIAYLILRVVQRER